LDGIINRERYYTAPRMASTSKTSQKGGRPMIAPERKDTWASGGAYEPYVGRWSRLIAREFLRWLAVPPGACWLDIGCGTGALSQTILEVTSPQSVLGVDPSEGYLAFAREQIQDTRADFLLGDAQALPVSSFVYDAVVSGLVLNFDTPWKKESARVEVQSVQEAKPTDTSCHQRETNWLYGIQQAT
jgi:SAM-dependent methyltransferase